MKLKVINVAPVRPLPGDVVGYMGDGVFVLLISGPGREDKPAHMLDDDGLHVLYLILEPVTRIYFRGEEYELYHHPFGWGIRKPGLQDPQLEPGTFFQIA